MKLHIYCIYDTAAAAFLPPWFMHNDALACRAFGEGANDPQHQFAKHPDEFVLYRVGAFEDTTGTVEAEELPVNLGPAAKFRQPVYTPAGTDDDHIGGARQ